MNAHLRMAATKPSFDLEPDICHLAREARAAQMMADELISQLKVYANHDCNGADVQTATEEAQELLSDFAARVAICASELRVKYYGGAR